MNITAAIVLFTVIWFMVFFIILPLRLVTQGERGEVVPGTHVSAPDEPGLKRKAIITTLIAVVIWSIAAAIILSGIITAADLDFFDLGARITDPS